MIVNVSFALDVDPVEWEGIIPRVPQAVSAYDLVVQQRISAEVRSHAESVVRDLFYDQGWISEHHPEGHPDRQDCSWCWAPRRRAANKGEDH